MVLDAIVDDRDYEFLERELISDWRVHYGARCAKLKELALQALQRILERDKPQDAPSRSPNSGCCRIAWRGPDDAAPAMGAVDRLAVAGRLRVPSKAAEGPPAAAPAPEEASYDWHVLLVAPFGSLLKDIPLPRSEVLVFDGQTSDSPGECYGIDAPQPRFLSQLPTELTLCFRHDHLARIEATVMLPAAEAPPILAAACALWQRNAAATAPQPAAAPDVPAGSCRGRDGGVDFNGRPEQEGDLDADRSLLPYTMTLDAYDPS